MTYDDWKTESPEDEYFRLNAHRLRAEARWQYMEDHADEINEERRERRLERD